MAAEERWYFTKQQLADTSNRKCGIDPDKELSYRQQAAHLIQDMGQRLQVNQLCINTAIVYMHRFYMFHSFTKFHRNAISTCALFLAAKVEEQPRKLEHVIKVAHLCLHREAPPLDTKSEAYLEQAQELVINENIMLQTLGFDVAIDHPHTHVVKCCQLVRGGSTSLHQHHASKDLAQTSYFMATNSLHLTTMCLQYKPTVVACVCIHLACKWGNWEIPISSEGKKWFFYVDRTVTEDLLEELTSEFLTILDRCPSRLKRKMMSANTGGEFSEMNCEALTQATTSRSSMSLTLNSLGSVKTEKFGEKHQDRDRSSSSRSGISHKPSAAGSSTSEKNGGVAQDRKERIKKEPHSNSYPGTASSGDSNQQAELASPAKSELIKVANSTDTAAAAQLSLANDGSHSSVKKVRTDGSSSKTITPKEYHEYRERSKREKEKVKQIGLADKSRNTASSAAVKQGKTDGIEKETMMQEVMLNNTSLSSLNLQPVVSLTHLDLAKFKNAKHFQLSAGSSSNAAAKQFIKIEGFATTDPAFSSTACSLVPGANQGSFAAVSAKRTPEQETKITIKSTPINSVINDSISQSIVASSGFSMGSILTPSPPSTKDGFAFSLDDMAVFTSPSELLVPVTPVEPEPVQTPLDFNKGKGEHKKQQRAEDSKSNLISSPPLSVLNNINEVNSNLVLSTSEHRKKDKSASKLMPDMLLDVKTSAISGVESDFSSISSNNKHNSKNQSTEKSNKHHRVKKSAPSINMMHLNDSLNAGGDEFLPQQDYHMTVTADYLNQNPMFDTNSESNRKSGGDVYSKSLSADVFSQSSSMLLTSAPSSNDAKNAALNFQEKQRHSNHVQQALQPPSIPIEMMLSAEKQNYESELVAQQLPPPPPPPQPIAKPEQSESKHSRRSLQSSSSKHEKKEKRKKHDKKDKVKEHGKDKERSEEKHVQKVPKLTIPKDVLGTSNSAKSDAGTDGNANHKPKDESLVVKIKLGGSKSGKNGNLPEVVSNAQSTTETLAVKGSSGLKLKFTKNPSSKESYIIGNDQEVKSKEKSSKDKVKESRKRSRSSSSPKNKDSSLLHEAMQTAVANTVSQQPPAKVVKTALSKSPKKGVNNPNVSNSSTAANLNDSALAKSAARAVTKNDQTQQLISAATMNLHNNNMSTNEYNRRAPTGHERGRGGGSKRNSRGNSRAPPLTTPPIHLAPPPPVPTATAQQMIYAGIPPPNMYDRRAGGNDAFNPYFAYDQNNFYAHTMQHGFQNDNSMFYPPNMPPLRPPPTHMGFPQSQFQQTGSGQQRGSRTNEGHQLNRQQGNMHQRSAEPPLPMLPPPKNPPPPPEN